MNLSPAKSQKADDRPISLVLDDQTTGNITSIDLFIRPEDMVRTYPSRMTVNQTLGSAWVDSFGEGLEAVTISGTLGWRTGPDGMDGGERLTFMRDTIYTSWHGQRAAAMASGIDPNLVSLLFVDNLTGYMQTVVPLAFEIRRSKSRPLLAQYRIPMVAVSASVVLPPPSPATSLADSFGLDSLFATIDAITNAINSATNWVNQNILAPIQGFLQLTSKLLNKVYSVLAAGQQLAGSIINVVRAVTQAGVNIFRTLAAVASIPQLIKSQLMNIAGEFSNAFCLLQNSLSSLTTYEDYNSLYGASNCSSTAGGAPPSQYSGALNPFYVVAPVLPTSVSVTTPASNGLSMIASNDVVNNPLPMSTISSSLNDINSGVVIA